MNLEYCDLSTQNSFVMAFRSLGLKNNFETPSKWEVKSIS